MTTLNLPYVTREKPLSSNIKMVVVISVIILISVLLCQKTTDVLCEGMSVSENNTYVKIPPLIYYTSAPQFGGQVIVSNINKKKLPLAGIVVIEPSGLMHKMSRKYAVNRKLGKNGISIEFNLPKHTNIAQIVLVVNVWCSSGQNMHTSRVSIRDRDKKVWENEQPLKWGKKYINVYVKKPRIIHGPPQQTLCNGDAKCTQENVLNEHLQQNVWD